MYDWLPGAPGSRSRVLAGCAVPALVLGALAARGGWYVDDLDFLVHGRRGFGINELLTPVNDHIVPGLRFMYALLALPDGPNHLFSVVVRVGLWFVAITLMAGLVRRLVPGDWPMWVAIVLYGFSAVVMPSFMSLSSAMNTLPAHVLGLVVIHATLDWFEGAGVTRLLAVVVALVASMSFWEKSGLILLTTIAVVVVAQPAPASARRWVGWAAGVALAVLSFGAAYMMLGTSHPHWPGTRVVLGLVGQGIASVLLPALAGGPWTWALSQPPYFGLADPPALVIVAGALAVVALLTVAARRAPRVLWLWATVLLFAVVGVPVVALGRYAVFGAVLTRHHHYWTDAAIPLTLAVVTTVAAAKHTRRSAVAAGVLALVWVLGTIVSYAQFAGPWGRNPSREYLASMAADVAAHPTVALWDSRPPLDVMPYISANRRISSLLGLTGVEGARFEPSGPMPNMVDNDGRIRPARLHKWAVGVTGRDCSVLLRGAGEVRIRLDSPLDSGEWSAEVGYLANPSSAIRAELVDRDGRHVPMLGADEWDAGLLTAYLTASEPTTATALVLHSDDPGTNLCVGDVTVGLVEVAR